MNPEILPKKILVVDDDLAQRSIYEDLFKSNGFEVDAAIDGLEAYEKALQNPPDLVFTGVIMPRMDGFELISDLRKHAVTHMIPIIMFSHLGREEDKERALQHDNIRFMIKGVDSPKVILEAVRQMLAV